MQSKGTDLSRKEQLQRLWARHNTRSFTGWAGRHAVFWVADQSGSSIPQPPIKQGITWLRLFRVGEGEDGESEHINVKEAGAGGAKGAERPDGSFLSSWRFTMAQQFRADGFLHPSYGAAGATRTMSLMAVSETVFGMAPKRLAGWGDPASIPALIQGSPLGESCVFMEAFFYGAQAPLPESVEGAPLLPPRTTGRQSIGVAYDTTFKLWVHLQTWEPVWVDLDDPAGPKPLDVAAYMTGQVEGPQLGMDPSRWLDDLPAARRSAPRTTTLHWAQGKEGGAGGRLVQLASEDGLHASDEWKDPPTVPDGYRLFRYTDHTYGILPLDLHTVLGPEPVAGQGVDVPQAAALQQVSPPPLWAAEFGALGYDGQWARMRMYYLRDGALDRVELVEY